MNKMNLARKINAAIWAVAAIVLMVFIYKIWSANGPYTFMSFFASLVMHGGFCFFIGYLIDEQIINYFKDKQ